MKKVTRILLILSILFYLFPVLSCRDKKDTTADPKQPGKHTGQKKDSQKDTVTITAWVVGPNAPDMTRLTNLEDAVEKINGEQTENEQQIGDDTIIE